MSHWKDNSWEKRGKVYKANTFAALKGLYGNVTKPGSEPKGIQRAATTPENGQPHQAKTQEAE